MNRLILFIALAFAMACSNDYSPKPKGYPRTDFPDREYYTFDSDCPFTFDLGTYTVITSARQKDHPCWLNLDYPFLKARIHLSYNKVDGNLNQFLEDARTLVYRHTIKASAIGENEIYKEDRQVVARIYELKGNAASSIQFYATDSVNHFLRGALYFNARTNSDSLRPAIEFIREDVYRLVESLEWRD